jgi:hypothetical protein
LFLRYLPDQVFVRALFIQIVFRLRLGIEFHEDVVLVHMCPGGCQLGNDHRTDLRSFEPRSKDYEGTRSLAAPIEPQRCREVFSFHSDDGFLDTCRCPAGPEMSEKESGHNEEEYSARAQDEFPGPSAGLSCLDHRLDYPGNFRRCYTRTGHLEFKSWKMVVSFESRQSHILRVPEFIPEVSPGIRSTGMLRQDGLCCCSAGRRAPAENHINRSCKAKLLVLSCGPQAQQGDSKTSRALGKDRFSLRLATVAGGFLPAPSVPSPPYAYNLPDWGTLSMAFVTERSLLEALHELSPFEEGGLGTYDYLNSIKTVDRMFLFVSQLLLYFERDLLQYRPPGL